MSILKTLKGTFKNVQDDISESLKALTVTSEKQKSPDPPTSSATTSSARVPTVNYDAGAEILHRNEQIWQDLYNYSEVTGQKAQDVDVQIGSLFVCIDKQSEILMKVHNEVSGLPKLILQLQDITDILAQVEEEYDKVEAALVHLENLCEEQEYRKNINSHHNQLAVYKMKKDHELTNYKVKLAREHARKVELLNKRKQHMLHEKQVAYEEEFERDVDFFKKHGKPGRSPSSPESLKKLDLSDVDIEEDTSALDEFLDSVDSPVSEPAEGAQSEVQSDNEGPVTDIIPAITSPVESKSEIVAPKEDGDQSDLNQVNQEPVSDEVNGSSTAAESNIEQQENNEIIPKENSTGSHGDETSVEEHSSNENQV